MKDQQAGNKRRATEAGAVWASRKAEIEWLYYNQEWSQQKIAGYYAVSQEAVRKIMRRLSIPSRGRARKGQANGNFKDGTQSTLYRMMIVKDKCSLCGATTDLCIHHKNGDHYDNHLENLQVLCDSCHNSMSKRLWWAAQKRGASTP